MSKNVKIIPGEMSDIDVDLISLVHKGANKQKIQIYKEDDSDTTETVVDDEEKGFFQMLKTYFTKSEAVPKKKTVTFASAMAVNDITENMWRVNDTLRMVMRDVINNDAVKDKKVALNQAIDEYAEYMKGKINASKITKSAEFYCDPEQKDREETELKKEELSEIMKATLNEALKPINDRLDDIEKGEEKPKEPEKGKKEKDEDIKDVLKAALDEALKPINDRLETVEKSRGIAKSQEGEEQQTEIEKDDDIFGGYFA